MKIYYFSPSWSTFATGSFTIFQTPNGTSPVADSPSDTLNFTSSNNTIVITGNSTTDSIDFQVSPTIQQYDIVNYTFFGGF